MTERINRPDLGIIAGIIHTRRELDDMREEMAATLEAVQAGEVVRITGWLEPERVQRLRSFGEAEPAELGHWLAMLADVRGGRARVDELRRALKAATPEPVQPVQRGDIAGDLPDGWVDPGAYVCTAKGLYRETDTGSHRITSRPIWIDQYLSEVNGAGDALRICWRTFGGTIKRLEVPRAVAASSRELVGTLATHGASITSVSAADVVRYLDEATTANESRIPRRDVSARLGWIFGDDGSPRGFLAGRDYIGRKGDPGVSLMADDGVESLAESYGRRGTWDGYIEEVVKPASTSAAFWLSTYNQIASILVRPLDLGSPWFIDRSGRTSQGKSTIGKAAAAVWQDPRAVPSWNTSKAGVEARAATLRDLPLMLDDSKEARRAEDVAAVVYMHGNGTGAIRGKPGAGGRAVGLRATERWSSAGDSSGEQRLTSFTNDAGSRARVLCLIGSPLASGEIARRVQLGAEAHFGHLGRRVVRHLLGADWSELKARFTRESAELVAALREDGAVAGRLGRIVAALRVAAHLVHAVGVPEPECDVWAAALASCRHGSEDADQPLAALRYVMQRCASERARFWHVGCEQPEAATPADDDRLYRPVSGGFAGRWNHDQSVEILQHVCEDWLRAGGYDAGTIERWHESGYLVTTSSSRKHTVRTRIAGTSASVYRIPMAMFEKYA